MSEIVNDRIKKMFELQNRIVDLIVELALDEPATCQVLASIIQSQHMENEDGKKFLLEFFERVYDQNKKNWDEKNKK